MKLDDDDITQDSGNDEGETETTESTAEGDIANEVATASASDPAEPAAKRAHNNAARAAIKGRGAKLPDDAKLFPARELTENIRQPDSGGFATLQFIIDNPGVTVGEFKAACATLDKVGKVADGMNHLRWDIGHGRITATLADGTVEAYEYQGRKTRAPGSTVVSEEWADGAKEAAPAKDAKPAKEPKPKKMSKKAQAAADAEAAKAGGVDPESLGAQPQGATEG